MNARKILIYLLAIFLVIVLPGSQSSSPNQEDIKRYLFASLHLSKTFHEPTQQGLYVYDIENGHQLVKEFPAKKWESYNQHQNTGWAGVGAHAGTGRFFQVQDGKAIMAYDILSEKLLWEVYAVTEDELANATTDKKRQALYERKFSYIGRRFGVTKDGKYLLVPDRDASRAEKLGYPVVRVLEAATGRWVKNIPIIDPENPKYVPANARVHNVHSMTKYIYVSMWNSGYIYCISPDKLEVVRRIGPVSLEGMDDVPQTENTEAQHVNQQSGSGYLTLEPEHQLASIQHFSVDLAEKYIFAEPVKALGIGIIDIESGKSLGRWNLPDPETGSVRACRYAIEGAEANQLHSKRNHGIAARPGTTEVWISEDRWGLAHVWDYGTIPPVYKGYAPVFTDIKLPVRDYIWINFSIDGKYLYASNRVIDADERVVIATLDGLNESSIEIQIQDGKVIRTGHDMGSGLATWIDSYGPKSIYQ